jgi:hypothetical protein
MLTFNHLRRRVSIEHSHDCLSVLIARNNRQVSYVFVLAWFSLGMLFLVSVFVGPLLDNGFSIRVLPALLILALLVGGWLMAARALIWRAFGVDEIVIQGGR